MVETRFIISLHIRTPMRFKAKHLSPFSGSPYSVTNIAADFIFLKDAPAIEVLVLQAVI